jgi:hypothetical protein
MPEPDPNWASESDLDRDDDTRDVTEATKGPADPGKPDGPDPTQPSNGDEEALLKCASSFASHQGRYYAVRVDEAVDGVSVEVSQVDPPMAAQPDETQEAATSEIIWGDTVATGLDAGHFGFEREQMWMVVEETQTVGLWRGRMSGETQFGDGVVDVTCWTPQLVVEATYDEELGRCVDRAGELARNDLPFEYVYGTGFGQCTTLSGQLNGEAFGYPVFTDLDLRGANLSEAKLHFAAIVGARFEGADLRTFEFGYATVSGAVDKHTIIPEDTFCEAASDGTRYECRQ